HDPPFEVTNYNDDLPAEFAAERPEMQNSQEPVTMTRNTGEPDNHFTTPKESERPSSFDYDQKKQERVSRLRELTMKIKTPEGLNEIESLPAFKRRQVELTPGHESDQSEVSRYTLGEGDEPNLSPNSFLHSNTD
ncbi:MAG: hypothetical protein R6V49_10815, partial [Bacteroidales bacterium]